jgi:fructosamine-3-kinase
MHEGLAGAVAEALATTAGERPSPSPVRAAAPLHGGCIHQAWRVELADGRRVFVKASRQAPEGVFAAEAEGLAALARPGVLRVPAVLAVGEGAGWRFLALELVRAGAAEAGFSARFGRQLAAHHRATVQERCGFAHDNWLGASPQPNGWAEDWCDFWRRRRLGHQLDLVRRAGRADGELLALGERLAERLGEWLDDVPGECPCLLHGDLWGGNYLVGEGGEPVLLDPAAYYGHREADLAMTRLFGGFDERFAAAYRETWPLPPGSEERFAIYELYHLLNHLVLFGGGYRAGCAQRLRRLVG